MDAVVKIFLRQPGQFVARRATSRTNFTTLKVSGYGPGPRLMAVGILFRRPYGCPVRDVKWLRVVDNIIDEVVLSRIRRSKDQDASRGGEEGQEPDGAGSPPGEGGGGHIWRCEVCKLDTHTTEQHRCHICTERGAHRGERCPNIGRGCALCARKSHNTGEHRCSVCKLTGKCRTHNRSREIDRWASNLLTSQVTGAATATRSEMWASQSWRYSSSSTTSCTTTSTCSRCLSTRPSGDTAGRLRCPRAGPSARKPLLLSARPPHPPVAATPIMREQEKASKLRVEVTAEARALQSRKQRLIGIGAWPVTPSAP
jgi:hypothetical protein